MNYRETAMVDVPIYTKAEMDVQLDRISALSAELETVKGELAHIEIVKNEAIAGWREAEAKLAGGEVEEGRTCATCHAVLASGPQPQSTYEATCEGADDPEERCPRHPRDCVCWKVDMNHPTVTHPAPTHHARRPRSRPTVRRIMTAAQYHAIVTRASQDYDLARYIDNTARMMQEQRAARETIRNAWITSAPPLPGMTYEGDGTRWKPL